MTADDRVRAPFETFEHTADVGIRAYGEDLPSLFANVARGMFDLIIDPAAVTVRERRQVDVDAEDLAGLLVAWLNELLLLFNGEGYVPATFDVATVTADHLSANVGGEPADPARHRFRGDVKAATYHGVVVEPAGEGWSAKVILDV